MNGIFVLLVQGLKYSRIWFQAILILSLVHLQGLHDHMGWEGRCIGSILNPPLCIEDPDMM
jgi:hypothetical protein